MFATIVCAEEKRTSSIKSTEELLEEVLNHSKLQAPSLYSSFELYIDIFESSIPSLSELLLREDLFVKAVQKHESLIALHETSLPLSYEEVEQIDFLNNLINHLSYSNSRIINFNESPTIVYTCKNNPVDAFIYSGEYTDYDYFSIEQVVSSYQSVVEIREPTLSYNCHSYAWYSQDEDNIYWIPYPGSFLNDGTYIQSSEWQIGDKIVYFSNGIATHSGIISVVNGNSLSDITVTSKWGSCGLYAHIGNDCPYMEDENVTFTVYRLCVHSENSYDFASQNVYKHSISCPTCGFLKSEEHTLNLRGICTVCGGKGVNIEFNSINEGDER